MCCLDDDEGIREIKNGVADDDEETVDVDETTNGGGGVGKVDEGAVDDEEVEELHGWATNYEELAVAEWAGARSPFYSFTSNC